MHKKVAAYFIGVLLMSFAFYRNTNAEIIPVNLRCEYLVNPQGLDVQIPRLSWKLKATDPNQRGQKQTAWQVLVASSEANLKANKGDLWDSSKVESDQTIHVEYAGKPLSSRMRCSWKVRVWDKDGNPSAWSDPAMWSMGLLDEADWQAKWLAADTYVPPQPPSAVSITGYHSAVSKSPDDAKWVAIDLGKVRRINAVRLFPTAPWGTKVKPGYMFPVRFKIEAAQHDDFSDSKIVVDQTEKDVPRPETEEAQRYDFEPVEARHVRLMASRLRDDGFGFGFTLAEMEVLSGEKNVAEGGTVTALDEFVHPDWSKARLVDGKAAPELAETVPQFHPNPMLRKEFEVVRPIRRVTAYVTGLGLYELRINGHRVGEERLAPQWTHYSHRVLYQTYDVTDLLQQGSNAVGVVLGDGWYRLGAFGTGDTETFWRPHGDAVQRLLLQIEIELEDGATQTVVTDETWKAFMDGPLRKATIYDGVEYDARKEIDGWDQPGFDDSSWKPVVIAKPNWSLTLSAQMNEPIRVIKEMKPIAMCEPEPGVYIFDLGQNLAGVCRFTVHGPTSSAVQLRHAEALKATGMLYRDNLSGVGGTGDMAENTDTYVLKGDGPEVFEPPFTYHGFRYVEVTYKPSADGKLPAKPGLDSLTALVIASDTRHVGEFECSDPRLSKLWQNIYWTYRSNMMSVVTDCAARAERWGWMGDAQESWQTLCYTMDMGAFGTKWVRDMHDSQHPDGFFTCASPGTGYAPAWSDAGIIIPWTSYVNYGDRRLIEVSFEPAKRYIEAILKVNPNYLWQNNIPKGDAYRDWLDARTVSLQDEWKALDPAIPTVPQDVFATAFWAYSTRLVSEIAAVLGKDDEAAYYGDLADNITAAFIKAYVSDDGRIQGNVQSCYALALGFGLLDEKYEALAVKHLLEAVKAHGNRLSTGIHSTKQLLLCLSKYGHHDLACHLVARPYLPSWGYMIANGATTIWERFDSYKSDMGFNPHPMNALNHVGLSSVGQWMFGEILGINPDEANPGYKHFVIRPRMGRGLTWARGSYDSIRGTIKTEWKCENDQFTLKVTVPPNTIATVYISTTNANSVKESGKLANEAEGVTFLRMEGDTAVFRVVSGSYHFSAPYHNRSASITPDVVTGMLSPDQFNPAIGGMFLMGNTGLNDFAHTVNYNFPLSFDPISKVATTWWEIPKQGIVYEPWQAGLYAYLMVLGYEMTRDATYLDETGTAMDNMLTSLTYSLSNSVYSVDYTDPVDFPITEIFGNAWGIAAGQKMYNITREPKYLQYSKDFLNGLLRQTFWYESNLEIDAKDQILHNLGLFRPHAGHFGAAPWETIEAFLPMTIMLKYDNRYAPVELLLRLFNLERINSFWFYPPVFRGAVVGSDALMNSPADYISIENFYMPEHGGTHGQLGRAIYMSQLSLWNYLLLEAFAQADDPTVMVLNLDVVEGFEAAIAAAERHFYIYNPTDVTKKFRVNFKFLVEGNYKVTIKNSSQHVMQLNSSKPRLEAGFALSLDSLDYIKVTIKHENAAAMKAAIAVIETAQDKLSFAYQLLQEKGRDRGVELELLKLRALFKSAMLDYTSGEYEHATVKAQEIITRLFYDEKQLGDQPI